jgi:hypothetical protein
MNLTAYESTIQLIVTESNHESKESSKHKILSAWRARLEKEPSSLLPFQIDQIVREVRSRLTKAAS